MKFRIKPYDEVNDIYLLYRYYRFYWFSMRSFVGSGTKEGLTQFVKSKGGILLQ